jgi:hypothetical protein
MGTVSGAVLEAGGRIVGIVPYAMVAAGGEGKNGTESWSLLASLDEEGLERVRTHTHLSIRLLKDFFFRTG